MEDSSDSESEGQEAENLSKQRTKTTSNIKKPKTKIAEQAKGETSTNSNVQSQPQPISTIQTEALAKLQQLEPTTSQSNEQQTNQEAQTQPQEKEARGTAMQDEQASNQEQNKPAIDPFMVYNTEDTFSFTNKLAKSAKFSVKTARKFLRVFPETDVDIISIVPQGREDWIL